jgi:hypothetical protein
MDNEQVDYDFLLSPPALRGESVKEAQAAADYRAAFRAQLMQDPETRARLEEQDAKIAWMRQQQMRGDG